MRGALKKEVSQYKPGALKKILGRDTYESLLKFSDNLDALGDVGKEGEIAAGSIWATFLKHPIAALSSIGKVKLIANGLGNPATAKAFLKIQETAGTDPEMQARAILSLINDTMVEEGIDVGGAASKAGKIIQGATQVAGQAGRVNRQVLPRALGAGSAEQSDQTRTSVRPAPTRPVFEIPNVSMPSFPDSDEPIGPIQQLRGNVQKEMLRRRARENPALASILLGGLGNADLL